MSVLSVFKRLFGGVFLSAVLMSCQTVQAQTEESSPEEHMNKLVGTWIITNVSVEGTPVKHKYQIKPGDKEGAFEHVWRVTGNSDEGDSLWEGKFNVTPASEKTLAVKYAENKRILPEDKAHDWQPFGMSYVAQVVGDQLYTQISLDREPWIWTREDAGMNVQDSKRLEVLAPLLATYAGKYENMGSKAYGAAKSTQMITSTGKKTETGTVILHEWTSIPEGGSAKDAFEARGIYSFSTKQRKIVKQYQTSTGVHMTGVLVSVQDDKLLWERTGEGPAGTIREFCQFDFSEPGVFRHRILSRTLNGVPVEEDEQDIVLKQPE
ncbi:hypothetical protein N9B17_04745 [Rhodopirellula sp.]|nr:hypothetical protein [Rhodopirellula sp.]